MRDSIIVALTGAAALAYIVYRFDTVTASTSTSSEPASDVDLSSSLDLGAAYGDAGTGFNASGRVEQIQDNDSTDMEGGMVGL